MNALPQINMVQLTMREDGLSLRQPMPAQAHLDPDFLSNLKAFLVREQAEKVFFSSKDPQQDIKVELSDNVFRWVERSPYGVQSFVFSFETKVLMYNDQPAESSFFLAFAKKLEDFTRNLQNDKIRILIKPRG